MVLKAIRNPVVLENELLYRQAFPMSEEAQCHTPVNRDGIWLVILWSLVVWLFGCLVVWLFGCLVRIGR